MDVVSETKLFIGLAWAGALALAGVGTHPAQAARPPQLNGAARRACVPLAKEYLALCEAAGYRYGTIVKNHLFKLMPFGFDSRAGLVGWDPEWLPLTFDIGINIVCVCFCVCVEGGVGVRGLVGLNVCMRVRVLHVSLCVWASVFSYL